jgi:hypothetical protein
MTEFKRETIDFDGQYYTFRSGWEQNYAYYLEWLKNSGEIKDWVYEPQRYYFIDYKVNPPKPLGNGYLPDFKVINNDDTWYLVEIKGRMQGVNKLKRMKRFYPEIKLELVTAKEYNELKKKVGKICNFI